MRERNIILLVLLLFCSYLRAGSQNIPGLIPFCTGNKWGYADTSQNIRIECKYDYAGHFSEGVAVVRKKDKEGYIDTSGAEITEIVYTKVKPFREGYGMVSKKGWWGIVDSKGREAAECTYDDIMPFSNGLAAVCRDGQWGFLNTSMNMAIPFRFEYVQSFQSGYAAVKLNSKWGLIDSTGGFSVLCEYYRLESPQNGYVKVESFDYRKGLVTLERKLIAQCVYKVIGDFNDGLAVVKKEDKYGYIDSTGAEIRGCKYEKAGNYYNGVAPVMVNGMFLLIGRDDETLYYNEKYTDFLEFTEGLLCVSKGDLWGVIDLAGNVIVPFEYESIRNFNNGMACVKRRGLYGYIDQNGVLKIPHKFIFAGDFENGLALVTPGHDKNISCYIDLKGRLYYSEK